MNIDDQIRGEVAAIITERYEKEDVIMGSNIGCGVVDGAGNGGGAREKRKFAEG